MPADCSHESKSLPTEQVLEGVLNSGQLNIVNISASGLVEQASLSNVPAMVEQVMTMTVSYQLVQSSVKHHQCPAGQQQQRRWLSGRHWRSNAVS